MSVKEIVRFQTDRRLNDMPYDARNENVNILEELFESLGFDVPKANRPQLKKEFDAFCVDVANKKVMVSQLDLVEGEERQIEATDVVDAYADVIVFAIGAIMKLGFDPDKVLEEVAKEINSRVGKMVDGKFEKDLSDEAKAKWYKADYMLAHIKKETK